MIIFQNVSNQQCNINDIHDNALNQSKSVTMEDLSEFHYNGRSVECISFKDNAQKGFSVPISP